MHRIAELEKEIANLKQDSGLRYGADFLKELGSLMKKSRLSADEVVQLLVLRGNLDQRLFKSETVYRLRHIFSIAEVFASTGADRPSWLPMNSD
jgi:hypothetical protein